VFHTDYRIWIVTVSSSNLEKVFSIIKKNKFHFDEEVLEFMHKCSNGKHQPPSFTYDLESGNVLIEIVDNPIFEDLVEFALGGKVL